MKHTFDDYFYSLIKDNGKAKKRNCLKCNKPFTSLHSGHRICAVCKQTKKTWKKDPA